MTRETKIGLLVGLAFIILFAIILSEQGTTPRQTTAPQFTRANNAPESTFTRGDSPLSEVGRLPIESVLPEPVRSNRGKPAHRPDAIVAVKPSRSSDDDHSLPTIPDSLLSKADSVRVAEMPNVTDESRITNDKTPVTTNDKSTTVMHDEIAQTPIKTPANSASESFSTRKRTLEDAIATISTNVSKSRNVEPATRTQPEPIDEKPVAAADRKKPESTHATPTGRTYTVKRGDTLTKIAKATLGKTGPRSIDAIYRANADQLDSRKMLRVGQVLAIPDTGDGQAIAATDAATNRDSSLTAKRMEKKFSPIDDGTSRTMDSSMASMDTPNLSKDPRITAKDGRAARDGKSTSKSKSKTALAAKTPRGRGKDRWYQVRPNDTLSRIAQSQLGSTRRHSEILELNRDVLGRKGVLRPGMKLRLPAKTDASDHRTDTIEAGIDKPFAGIDKPVDEVALR